MTLHSACTSRARRAALAGAAATLLSMMGPTGPAWAATPAIAVITEPVGSDRLPQLNAQFDAWKKAKLVSSVKLLKAQPGQKDAGFANLAIVTLPDDKAFKTWSVDVQGRLGQGAIVRQADLVKQEGQPSKTPAQAVHVASLYATHVPATEYKSYTTSYITPNMNLQRKSGIMSQYTMYLERDPVEGVVRSLLVMEYVDEGAYARREAVKAAGKQQLTSNAGWKRINDTKESIRTDISSTAASEIALAGGR
ncbi:hypothetical protein [Roseateles sp.]|uniref:hypothetical protein n=1 Tax=Roseateles sp. TaxID=1971397 RepID=UPI002F41C14F